MKNYVIGFLIICLVVSLSFIYKNSKIPVLVKFPVRNESTKNTSGEPLFYLYIFFSQHNCPSCLGFIKVLNELPPSFVVTGIVSGEELENEKQLRQSTGAGFKLIPFGEKYRRFKPHYTPAIFGVTGRGRVLFVLPGVPGEKKYLYDFLVNFYGKSLELLIADST